MTRSFREVDLCLHQALALPSVPGACQDHGLWMPFLEPFHSAVIFAVPMFHSVEKQVSRAFRAHIQARYGIDFAAGIEQSRQSDFDMAVPAEFQLAKQFRQSSSGSHPSVVRQTDWTSFNDRRARLTFSKMSFALAVQINGLGF